MPSLSNKVIKGPFSYAGAPDPYVLLQDDQYLFDAQMREFPVWLGTKSSAMFGMTQFLETWSAEWTDELERVKDAYLQLVERSKDSLCGRLRLKPIEPPTPEHGQPLKPAALLYQYTSLSILDQFSEAHQLAANAIESEFAKVVEQQSDHICNPYVDGANFEFGFEFKSLERAQQFRQALFQSGILIKPIRFASWVFDRWPDISSRVQQTNSDNEESQTAAKIFLFQLNFTYRPVEMKLFWERVNLAFKNFQDDSATYDSPDIELPTTQYDLQCDFHRGLIKAKSTGKLPRAFKAKKFLETRLEESDSARVRSLEVVILDKKRYSKFREQILKLQGEIYEPARRTPPEEFDMLFDSENPLAILLLNGPKIAAMVFAGRLGLFTQERGVTTDPFVDEPDVYYSMDLTVLPDFRGGMGRLMKQALVLLAVENGVSAIHGRNRDRLAAGMWAINLSLGSYELQRLPDDYPDDEDFRDCIYYRCPLHWPEVDWKRVKKFNLPGMLGGQDLKNTTLYKRDEPT